MLRIRTVAKVVALAAIALLMTGCIKLDMDLKVSSDNKVSGTVVVAFNKQLLSLTGQDPSQVIAGSGVNLPASAAPGTSVAPYSDDQFAGETITYDNVDLSQFDQGNAGNTVTIERVGDEFRVSGTIDFTNEGGANNPLGGTAQQALSSAQLSIKLTFPGAVSTSNGQIDGNSVTWVPKIGEKTDLTASASAIDNGSSFPVWIVVVIVLVVLLAVVAFVVSRRRRGPEPQAAPVEATPPPPADALPPPP